MFAVLLLGAYEETSAHVYVPNDSLRARVMEAREWLKERLPRRQWRAVKRLNDAESHWNPKSGEPSWCYGIPQSCPGSKMRSAIREKRGEDWDSIHDPLVQLLWQTFYVKARYGTYVNALRFQDAHGWY